MKKAIVILSGGLDSSTALCIAKDKGYELYALTFTYGQRHHIEVSCAKKIAGKVGVKEHRFLSLPIPKGSALTDNIAVPKGRNLEELSIEVPPTYVPARNTLFIAYALQWAEEIGADAIFTGLTATDASPYPDTRPEYVEAYQHLIDKATKQTTSGQKIELKTPLLHLYKSETVSIGMQLGVPYEDTWSCLIPETLIATEKGLIPIKDISKGDCVYTHKGRLRKVLNTFKFLKTNEELYKIDIYGSPSIICTEDHKFLTTAGWKKIKNITKEDIVLFYKLSKHKEESVSADFAKMLGLFAAEGSWKKNISSISGMEFTFSSFKKDENSILFIKTFFQRLGFNPRVIKHKKANSVCVSIQCIDFAKEISKELGESLSKDRSYLHVLKWNKDAKLSFLEGAFLGDSYYDKTNDYINYSSINFNLSWTLYELLKEFNCIPRLKLKKPYQVNGKYPQMWVGIQATEIPDLIQRLGIKSIYKKRRPVFFTKDGSKIRSIQRLNYSGYVYDLTVEEDESYIAYNIPVHNCYSPKKSLNYDDEVEYEPCLSCDTCTLRIKGFIESGYKDPAVNEIRWKKVLETWERK